MLKKILFLLTLSLVTLSLVTFAKAAITNSSRVIPYQGRLTDSSGNNVADGTYAMTFKIYTVSSGGSAAFTESFSAGNAVSVSSGLFSVLLGSLSANGVNLDFANPPYYLGITIAANSEMTPRIQLGFAPLAHNSQYLDGTPLSSFQLNTGVLTGAAGTNTRLQATGTGTGSTGNGSIYFLNSSGGTVGRIDTVTTSSVGYATGGTITYSGGYTIHTFTSSGTFTPSSSGTVEYLVVAGGGGGGGANGAQNGSGGGGAGGFLTGTGFSVSGQAYSVTVGAGGGGGVGDAQGTDGGNSVFSTITAYGGGGGASEPVSGGVGRNGGSGGGASGSGAAVGTGISGQGNDGGLLAAATTWGGGGGGGASAVGARGTPTGTGSGGAGTASSISGSSVTYAGGGGGGIYYSGSGGPGGAGGGGAGGSPASNGNNATANTGGGGGGASPTNNSNSYNGGNGGSGIVIIRYPTVSYNYGTLNIGSTNTTSADLAEYYVTEDKTLSAGDVVRINSDSDLGKGVLHKANKPYDSKLVGVISTNPGVVLGSIDGDTGKSDKRQLALAGRVPVKIDPDSDPIDVGDFLTSSDKPGFAKKATESGYVIGKALEKWSGQSTIEVFINLIYKQEKSEIEILKDDVRTLKEEVLKLKNK